MHRKATAPRCWPESRPWPAPQVIQLELGKAAGHRLMRVRSRDGAGLRGAGEVLVLDLLELAAGQHLRPEPCWNSLTRASSTGWLKAEAELLQAQHPAHREPGGIQLLGLDEVHQGGLVAGDEGRPGPGEHPTAPGRRFAVMIFCSSKPPLSSNCSHVGAHRAYGVLLGILGSGEGQWAAGEAHQHYLGIADGASPLEQRVARLGAGGGRAPRWASGSAGGSSPGPGAGC